VRNKTKFELELNIDCELELTLLQFQLNFESELKFELPERMISVSFCDTIKWKSLSF